eukprot:m.76181 g.76181  ORF g.76181 m.76181 type:complete len:307 (+) comp24869_c0_seq2:184-1104(+)
MLRVKPIGLDLLATCSCQQRRRKEETAEQYVQRLTHIGLAKRGITSMDGIQHASNVSALYLYDNTIPAIIGLQSCRYLTQLFLQRNKITKMEGLSNCTKLKKLHLGHNRITVIEGIEKLTELREMHIEHQVLPAGEKLVFDPRCTIGIKHCLTVLNIAGNRVDDLGDLAQLKALSTLNLSDNFVRSIKEIINVMKNNSKLIELRISGNPICHLPKYRENIIVSSPELRILDAKAITPIQREFLLNWKISRSTRRSRTETKSNRGAQLPPATRALYPSRFSSKNPHWLPPIPHRQKRNQYIDSTQHV